MPQATQIPFSYKDLAELMIRQQGLHEGIWGVYLRFGIQAMNVGQGANDLLPSAIVPVAEVGLQKFEEVNNLSVDAAKVNPKPTASKSKKNK